MNVWTWTIAIAAGLTIHDLLSGVATGVIRGVSMRKQIKYMAEKQARIFEQMAEENVPEEGDRDHKGYM